MEKLLEKLDDAAKLVAPMLEEKISEEIYINALRELILALNETTAEEIEKLEIDFAVKNSLGADKSLIKKSFPKEADQVSLISTLVTYEACRREGMPDHSSSAEVKKVKRKKGEDVRGRAWDYLKRKRKRKRMTKKTKSRCLNAAFAMASRLPDLRISIPENLRK
jgi:hypothetical protein